ncbi:MAG TPA: transaldolase family protein [Actinomycetota bacterium]|nr:transaldolase family protein [Actinomycetota bacterium]
MKIFVDSANLADLEAALSRGFPAGVTTNPSILAKEEKRDYREHIRDIIDLIRKWGPPLPLSVEVFSTDPDEMFRQAEELVASFGDYPGLTVKVPIGWEELRLMARLFDQNISVNATACMSFNQAVMALNAGARYVSLFWGRIKDTGYDPARVVADVRAAMDRMPTSAEIIVGSIRHLMDVNEAMLAGAHIVTVPPPFLVKMCQHPKTDQVVAQFCSDFARWLS